MDSRLLIPWYRLRQYAGRPVNKIEALMFRFGAAHPNATFIQVGANDGSAVDPLKIQIARRQWRGIMVEPVPYVFERLAARYQGHPRVRLAQVAIADQKGILPFYHLRKAEPGENVWKYYHALGSFRREVLLSHENFIPDIASRVVETEVPCSALSDIWEDAGWDNLDLLFIDTEGYDFEILRTVDFDAMRPRMVVYEHVHLSEGDHRAARELLEGQGYLLFEHGLDTAALDSTRLTPADAKVAKFFRTESSHA